ncbi:MAG: hypothetical protein KGL58_01485, partial [Pseudomonadota bacterium]|nr:hypothetical protein [Pseudomonadota bacterium]
MKKDSAGFNRFKLLIWPGLMGIGLWALFLFNQWAFVNHHLVMSDARWSYGMGFALIAGFMLGGLTRLGPAVPVLVWRTLTLIMASLMAWVEVSLHHYPSGYAG